MSRQTMSWRRMGRMVVTVHTENVPSDADWAGYMAQVDAFLPLTAQRILVISAGGGPNGKQRKLMVDALDGVRVPVAIITTSALMRGAGVAVSWFNPSLKILGPGELERAMDYLELTAWERTECTRVIGELERELGLEVVKMRRAVGL